MITDINASNLDSIRNPYLRQYAAEYVTIYQDFIEQVSQIGLEMDVQDATGPANEKIEALRQLGVTARNAEKSLYLNRISPACVACQTGQDSATYFISLKCHRDCFFCFNPNQENYAYFREQQRDVVKELEEARAARKPLKHIALTGGEPLLHKDEAVAFFGAARRLYPQAYTRLYTSGDHIDAATLEALQQTGLDEIRFSIRLHDLAKGHRHTYDRIALARDYMPHVMVEMPVLPGALEEMKAVLLELDGLGIDGINLLELCFPLHNADVYRQKGYRIKARPFRILYDYWYAGGLPVAGSETTCLELLEFAAQAGLHLGVHYCSLENKHTGQIFEQNHSGDVPRLYHFSEKDYFLKSARVFGEDVPRVRQALSRINFHDYQVDEGRGMLEFPVRKIKSLKHLDVEIGLCTSVVEVRGSKKVIRELKVDLTSPQTFDPEQDI